MGVPVPTPVHNTPSLYIPPEDILTLEWVKETFSNPPSRSSSRTASTSSDYDEDEVPSPSQLMSPSENATIIVGRQPDELVQKLMIKTFIDTGRLSHYYRVLSYFPGFMEKYQRSFSEIVKVRGPLGISERYYIGIMVLS